MLGLAVLTFFYSCLPNPEPYDAPVKTAVSAGVDTTKELSAELNEEEFFVEGEEKISLKPNSPKLKSVKLLHTKTVGGVKVETYDIKYKSDGLVISGFIVKPKGNKRLPVFIYNRPGKADKGTHGKTSIKLQGEFASKGFVVMSTQLRGNKFCKGVDEMGGKDLNDILNLIEIAKTLNCAKPQEIAMYGLSRGGVNAFQISRMSDDVKCFAVVGTSPDLSMAFRSRPNLYKSFYKKTIGDSTKFPARYEARSPIRWANEINEPFLILHGDADKIVDVKDAEKMAKKLESFGKVYSYKTYKDGNHNLSNFLSERNKEILKWFKKFLDTEPSS